MWAPHGSEKMDGWPIVAGYLKEVGMRVIATNCLFTKEHPRIQVLVESLDVNIVLFHPRAGDGCFIALSPVMEVSAL